MHDAYLDRCKALVEEKLDWGPSESWKTQDFEELSIRMQDSTGRVISTTTLKRIWGHVVYESKPSRHSLDTLAAFVGYDSWRKFTSSLATTTSSTDEYSADRKSESISAGSSRTPVLILSIFMLLLGAATVLWLGLRNSSKDELSSESSKVHFVSRSLAYDLPNTVVFEYDVSNIEADSFFIQQSWDRSRRTRISPENSAHSSIYFYPGYYIAKLIANDTVLEEHPVHVKTRAWIPILEENPTPVYLPDKALSKEGALSVSKEWLEGEGYSIDDGDHVLSYYYVQDFGPLLMENFTLKAVVLHEKPEVRRPCQGGQVTVRGEDGMIRFPFDIPGCTGMMSVSAGEVHISSETHDLSPLGADYSTWQLVNLDVKEKNVRIQIGTNPPLELSYSHDMGKVVGLWFQFVGRGAIDEVSLSDGNRRIMYEEKF